MFIKFHGLFRFSIKRAGHLLQGNVPALDNPGAGRAALGVQLVPATFTRLVQSRSEIVRLLRQLSYAIKTQSLILDEAFKA